MQLKTRGPGQVMEFKINEVTKNPVPTDVFAFRKLASQYARGNQGQRKNKTGRGVPGARRDSQGGSVKQVSQRRRKTSKNRRRQVNGPANQIFQFEGGDSTEPARPYQPGSTNSQLIDMTQQIIKNGQANNRAQAPLLNTAGPHIDASSSPTLDQSQVSDPVLGKGVSLAHAPLEDGFIQAQSPSHYTSHLLHDEASSSLHAKKLSQSS